MHKFMQAVFTIIMLGATLSFAQVEDYVLKPGDVITVSVVEHPEFSGRHKIRPDGKINYPVIGEVEVASLTCAQLVKIMQGKLAAYINNPVVSVAIEAYYSNNIYIINENGSAGQYAIYEPIDVMKALAMSGGLKNQKTQFLKIIRADGTVVKIPMKDFWGTDSRRDNRKYMLYPGDTLFIPTAFTIPWSMISTIIGGITTCIGFYFLIKSLPNR